MQIIHDDCLNAIRQLIADGVQVDSIVSDPPYELGFMGKAWDSTGIAYSVELWKLCLEILKPGGHLLSFGGSRTYHRMACAIEDAGFEVRDQIMWVYGQGFPKSLDISKAIDKAAGAENELAKQWQGWGTALKPAHEPIVLARKPLSEKTVAANVLKHGTGAINIDGCRVSVDPKDPNQRLNSCISKAEENSNVYGKGLGYKGYITNLDEQKGRFPANLIHDGSDEVEAEFALYGEKKSGHLKAVATEKQNQIFGKFNQANINEFIPNSGSASRFFYNAKASKKDRNGSKHPTVKPIALMQYLCRLVTPPGGIVLDPFAGSGTTGQAAIAEGFKPILIEREEQYISDIKKRLEI